MCLNRSDLYLRSNLHQRRAAIASKKEAAAKCLDWFEQKSIYRVERGDVVVVNVLVEKELGPIVVDCCRVTIIELVE